MHIEIIKRKMGLCIVSYKKEMWTKYNISDKFDCVSAIGIHSMQLMFYHIPKSLKILPMPSIIKILRPWIRFHLKDALTMQWFFSQTNVKSQHSCVSSF